MAAPLFYSGGIGGTTGAELATLSPLLSTGNVWYVHSGTGSDAAAPRGQDRARPLATIEQAHTNAADGDVIVILSGHLQTFSGALTLTKALTIVGEGSGSSRPKFSRTGAVSIFVASVAGIHIHNLYFPATTGAASATTRISVTSYEFTLNNCYVECGASDTGAAMTLGTGAHDVRIIDTTFISTATSTAAQPSSALNVSLAVNDLVMDNVVFDGGTTGWSAVGAWISSNTITRLRATNIDLLRDSDVQITTGSTGYLHVRNKSGSARVTWP